MENKIDFKMIDENYRLRNLVCDIKINKNPEFFFYEKITRRIFVGFLDSKMIEELKLMKVKKTIFGSLNCSQSELRAEFVKAEQINFYKKVKQDLKEIVMGKEFHFITHKMAVDLEKSILYHLESSWKSQKDPETQEPIEVLVNQFLACYEIAGGSFRLKGKKEMKDIKKSIMFYHGQDNHQLKLFKKSPIVGLSVPMHKDWDLNIAFSSSQQIHVKIIGSNSSFEILFYGVVYGSNYTQKLNQIGCRVPPRISSCGSISNGEISYVHFDINNQNYVIIENEINLSSSVMSGSVGVDGKLYPTEKAETHTLSLLFSSKAYRDERLCISEVLEESPINEILDFARLGRYRKDFRSLNQLHVHFGHRKRIAIMHGDSIKIFTRLNFNDVLFVIVLSIVIAKESECEPLLQKLMKDLSYYALKMGLNLFCSSLLFLIMAESTEEFLLPKDLLTFYEKYMKTFGIYPNFSEELGRDPLSKVRYQTVEILHFLGFMNEMSFRDKIFKEIKNDAQFSRIVDFHQFSSLTSDFSSRSFALIFTFANIVNANWGRLFFDYNDKKRKYGKSKMQNRVAEEEVIVTIRYLERLKKSIVYWKSFEGNFEKIEDPVYKYFFENEFKMREKTKKMNAKLNQKEKQVYQDDISKLFEKSGEKSSFKGKMQENGKNKQIYKEETKIEEEKFLKSRRGVMNKTSDRNVLESIFYTVERTIEILTLCLQLNKSEILKDSLQKDVKIVLSKLKFEEIIFIKIHEYHIKRVFFKMMEIDPSEIKLMKKTFNNLISTHELTIFKILRNMKQMASKLGNSISSKSILSTNLISLEECIKELKYEIPHLKLVYLIDTFKSFIHLDMVDEFISLLILRTEFLHQQKPKLEKKIQTFSKLVKNNNSNSSKREDSNKRYDNSFAKSNVLEINEKLDENLIEQDGLMKNIFGIVVELSGLEKKEEEYFSLPKIFKRFRTLDKLWGQMIPKTKPVLIKSNWSKLTGRESALTFFQSYLIKKNQSELKTTLLNTLRKILNCSSQNLRMKMLVWLFGEGKLSLIDKIDSKADNLKITNDLCKIAQKEGIINSKNGTESCLYLIKSFETRKKFDIVIDLIFKMVDNEFFGSDVNRVVESSEAFLMQFLGSEDVSILKGFQDWKKKIKALNLPSLRTKIVHLARARSILEGNKIVDISVENKNKILTMIQICEDNFGFQKKVKKHLKKILDMLNKTLKFVEKLVENSEILKIDKMIYPGETVIRSRREAKEKYQIKKQWLNFTISKLEISLDLLSSKMYQKPEVIATFVKKFKLWEVYIENISDAFLHNNEDPELKNEFQSAFQILLNDSSSICSIQDLIDFGKKTKNLRKKENYQEITENNLTLAFLEESLKSNYIYPKNFQSAFSNLKKIIIKRNQIENLFNFEKNIGMIVEKIEAKNCTNNLINFMLDELGQYIRLDQLGRGNSVFLGTEKATRMLRLVNIGELDCVWVSLFFKDLLEYDLKKYCYLVNEVQETMVKYSNFKGSEKVELAFRFAVTLTRMLKELSIKLKSVISQNLTEKQKFSFIFFSSKLSEFRRILHALIQGELLDEYSITDERSLYIKYLADCSQSYMQDLKNDFRFGKTIFNSKNG